ncbi:hypothetical protein D3C87_1896070 [compost metagenome]
MRFTVAEHVAARAIGTGQRQGIGGGAGGNEEHRDIALKHIGEFLFHTFVEFAGAVGGGKATGRLHEAFGNHGMGARPVVGRENHDAILLFRGKCPELIGPE